MGMAYLSSELHGYLPCIWHFSWKGKNLQNMMFKVEMQLNRYKLQLVLKVSMVQNHVLLPTAREGNVFTGVRQSFCSQSASWLLGLCSSLLQCGRYASYWNVFLLPPATKLCQGYVFTGIYDSVHGGVHGRGHVLRGV